MINVCLLLAIAVPAYSVVINCDLIANSVGPCGCSVSMIQNQEISEVTEIIEDQQRKDNFDFIYFSAFNKKFSTFPKGLHKYFPDLRHFTMDNCALTSISSADLAPWPKLYYFSVARNNIKTLDGDLFQNSPSLTIIKFEDNLIETVGINLLSGLPKLRKANFSRNRCIKFSAETPERIEILKNILVLACLPPEPLWDFPSTSVSSTSRGFHDGERKTNFFKKAFMTVLNFLLL